MTLRLSDGLFFLKNKDANSESTKRPPESIIDFISRKTRIYLHDLIEHFATTREEKLRLEKNHQELNMLDRRKHEHYYQSTEERDAIKRLNEETTLLEKQFSTFRSPSLPDNNDQLSSYHNDQLNQIKKRIDIATSIIKMAEKFKEEASKKSFMTVIRQTDAIINCMQDLIKELQKEMKVCEESLCRKPRESSAPIDSPDFGKPQPYDTP
jgi:hypothetical protein